MRGLLVALVIFGTIPFILQRPYLGLLVWSWIGYMNPHRLSYNFAYDFPWVMLIAIVTLISLAISKEPKRIPKSAFSVMLFVFLAWTGVTTIFAAEQASAALQLETFAKILAMVYVTLIMVNDRERVHWLIWVIVISIGFYGIKGGVFTIARGGAFHVNGPPGTFISNNNDLAQAFCMLLPLIRYLQLQAKRKAVRVGLVAAMVLTGIATLGTYSRGGMITLAVVTAALFLKSRGRIAVAIAFVVIGSMAYHFMPPQWTQRMGTIQHAEDVNTAQTRMQSWEFAANVALHRPVLGGGFNVYESPKMWLEYGPEGTVRRAVHSIYFRVLGEQGFPGLVIFLTLLVISWRNCTLVRKRCRDLAEDKWAFDLASMLQVSILAFMVNGLATTSAYFDLSFQLMAVCAQLKLITAARPEVLANVSSGMPALDPQR